MTVSTEGRVRSWKMLMPAYVPLVGGVKITLLLPVKSIGPASSPPVL